MKKILRRIFGFRQATPANKLVAQRKPDAKRDSLDDPATIEDGSDNAMRRQLVQVLLRDVLRQHGIPAQWIDCQMLVVASRSRGTGMYVRLVITHWDERLMNHTFAFQNALLAYILRFEPKAAQWLHGISWQLEVADTCPYLQLPGKSFWQSPDLKNAPGKVTHAATVVKTTAPPTPADLAAAVRQANAERRAAPAKLNLPTAPLTPQAELSAAAEFAAFSPTIPFEAAEQPTALADAALNATAQNLDRLFEMGDLAISQRTTDTTAPAGYEKTLPSPL